MLLILLEWGINRCRQGESSYEQIYSILPVTVIYLRYILRFGRHI